MLTLRSVLPALLPVLLIGTMGNDVQAMGPLAAMAGDEPSLEWSWNGNPDTAEERAVPERAVCTASRLDGKKLERFAALKPTSERWGRLLAVHVVPASGIVERDQPPVAGHYRVEGETLHFTTRHPVSVGVTLRVRLDPRVLDDAASGLGPDDTSSDRVMFMDFTPTVKAIGVADARRSVTSLVRISPANDLLPEILLRIYIHFSAPMSQGEAYRHIRLLEETGKPVPDPFLELDEELWTRDGRRFTLLFDPGRIKRGLKPREEVGPILEEGKSYTLEIDRSWPDANGNPLKVGFRKSFRVGPPDATTPDPANWKFEAPRGACLDLLKVRFPEPLDRALSLRLISVQGPDGQPVRGSAELDEDQTLWQFKPEAVWQAGQEYRLVIGTDLEDLVGNGIGRPFEVDLTGPITTKVRSGSVALPFRVRPAAR